jgi:hypothetical protein
MVPFWTDFLIGTIRMACLRYCRTVPQLTRRPETTAVRAGVSITIYGRHRGPEDVGSKPWLLPGSRRYQPRPHGRQRADRPGQAQGQAEQRGAGGGRAARAAPARGNSPWRPLYRRVGEVFVIAAIEPEAQHDKRGFDQACQDVRRRFAAQGDDQENVRTTDRP